MMTMRSLVAADDGRMAQRRTMRDDMMHMQHGMMGHMTEHMQAGTDSMAICPIMKQMGEMTH